MTLDVYRGRKTTIQQITYETEYVLFLAVLENSVLPMGWDSSHATLKSDVRTLNFRNNVIFARPRKTQNDCWKRSLCDVKCQKKEKTDNKNNF